jgi:membrane protein YqaA with SNARE-associated domain
MAMTNHLIIVLLVMALVVLIGSAAGWYLGEWLTRRTSR